MKNKVSQFIIVISSQFVVWLALEIGALGIFGEREGYFWELMSFGHWGLGGWFWGGG